MFTPTARGLRLRHSGSDRRRGRRPSGRPEPARAAEPPKLAGTWTWTWKDRIGETHRHILEVEGVGTKLAARELFDDQPAVAVSNLTLDGSIGPVHRRPRQAGKPTTPARWPTTTTSTAS